MRGALAASLLVAGCGDASTFAIGRDLEPCIGNVPTACGVAARCVLDTSSYLEGDFPSARRFIVRTEGSGIVHLQLLLTDERAPGTELLVVVHEPSCGQRVTWDSGGRDLFRLTGSDGVIQIPIEVAEGGDHLVEVTSDAYCSYALKWDP